MHSLSSCPGAIQACRRTRCKAMYAANGMSFVVVKIRSDSMDGAGKAKNEDMGNTSEWGVSVAAICRAAHARLMAIWMMETPSGTAKYVVSQSAAVVVRRRSARRAQI